MAQQHSVEEQEGVRLNASLAGYTSWGVGGCADCLFLPRDIDALSAFLAASDDESLMFLGYGSNVLIRDGGVRGVVVMLNPGLSEVQFHVPDELEAGAGTPCARIAKVASGKGLAGVEFLAGIPGTLGGALAMNAGAYGGELWNQVVEVCTVDRAGLVRWRSRHDYEIGYRQVRGPSNEWFVAARLKLEVDSTDAVKARVLEMLSHRGERQPVTQKTCGSVFKNPPNDYAARLIEACGLKDFAVGGARVSTKHANFIVNDDDATAADIEALIDAVRTRVERKMGVKLELEVRIIGDTGDQVACG